MTDNKPMKDRIALITGASRGIGFAMAVALAKRGAHVVAVARTEGALEELDDAIRAVNGGRGATLVPMDITDGAAVDRLGAALYERFGRLDALFLNAGVLGENAPVGHIDPDKWEKTIAVNLTAPYRCVRSFDPLLRQSEAARVVFVTSRAGRYCKPYWGGYAVSKAGLECLAKIYAAECETTTNIRVNILNPGPVRTRLRAAAFPGENPASLPPPEQLAEAAAVLFSSETATNGVVYDFMDGKLTPQS